MPRRLFQDRTDPLKRITLILEDSTLTRQRRVAELLAMVHDEILDVATMLDEAAHDNEHNIGTKTALLGAAVSVRARVKD